MKRFALVAALVLVSPALAQTPEAADAAWWSGLASQAIAALAALLTAAVAALAPFLLQFIRSRSKLAAILVSQAMADKLVAGINAQIRAEAEKLQQKLGGKVDLTPEDKDKIATNAQPKVEAAFKETLEHFKKQPGSQAVKDMILGRVETALANPAAVPHVLSK